MINRSLSKIGGTELSAIPVRHLTSRSVRNKIHIATCPGGTLKVISTCPPRFQLAPLKCIFYIILFPYKRSFICTYAARMTHKTSSLAEISQVKRPNLGPSIQFLLIVCCFFSSKHHACSVTVMTIFH